MPYKKKILYVLGKKSHIGKRKTGSFQTQSLRSVFDWQQKFVKKLINLLLSPPQKRKRKKFKGLKKEKRNKIKTK